jgi:hypothetical protein
VNAPPRFGIAGIVCTHIAIGTAFGREAALIDQTRVHCAEIAVVTDHLWAEVLLADIVYADPGSQVRGRAGLSIIAVRTEVAHPVRVVAPVIGACVTIVAHDVQAEILSTDAVDTHPRTAVPVTGV